MSVIGVSDRGGKPGWLRAAPALFLLLWSSGFVFLKLGLRDADPLTFLALRYACVVALLAGPFLWLRPAMPRTRRAWLNLIVVGLLLQAGYFSFTYLSLKLGMSAGAVALVTSQQPILVGLLAPALAGERVGALRWVGLALGAAGAVLVILARGSVAIASPWALAFALLALACITGGTLWEKRFGTDVHPVGANLVQYAVGLAVSAPLAFALEPMHVHWSAGLAGSLAYLVICNSLIAISLLLAMVRHGEASRVSALFFLIPPATSLIALAVLGETIGALAWPGMALAAAGLYLVMRY
ncbi:DMT family transporter [Burkholderia multivorans]|uniref:DMT family transporter n=1 Tax=Burkholderia multivorans TaxID=87883 RepID=UPI000D008747|nr:DMT family transporter [Burkholderia multivorans]MBU9237428.1 DMT family transporter [Burkholderia multivorans]MDR8762846.1 putative amino-acid metabolite efflux pump [Burkholderia multivorans]MDR8766423.1 putative amino-acid metabolite efflux pump [Burkholderia multivorans]MDR8772607.1 putative amino-acid metabolite efflux pump [Burkholderia multivorans]MDR8788696.1 putative amino-acid metabolite efflux pump [Burkholderia multivorans]